jgi:MAF protein
MLMQNLRSNSHYDPPYKTALRILFMPDVCQQYKLILASSSHYRQEIFNKLALNYESISPDIDESSLPLEAAEELVARLALAKTKAAAAILNARTIDAPRRADKSTSSNETYLIVGSDQVAVIDNKIITKPLTHNNACKQLRQASSRQVIFLTSLCLFNTHTGAHQLTVVPYTVNFLPLTDLQIENYLTKEQPYDCAGSFKSEGLGITLFESVQGDDPNTLIGLPLIALVKMLREEGIDPLSQ